LFWSKAICPVDLPSEAWTYLRLRWLLERFGRDRLTRDQLLPTDTRYAGLAKSPLDVTSAFALVCDIAGVDPREIDLEVHPETDMPGALGLYVPGAAPAIWLVETQLDDCEGAFATLAHEISHHLLMGPGHLTGQEPDHEQVTDLLTACLGFGVVAANSTIREKSERVGHLSWWAIAKSGYLSAHLYGWVLAVVSWLKGDSNNALAEYLRLDASDTYTRGLKHLRKHGSPTAIGNLKAQTLTPQSMREIPRLLRDKADINRLLALRQLLDCPAELAAQRSGLAELLRDAHPVIRSEAAVVLGSLGHCDDDIVRSLVDMLHDRSCSVRTAAAICIGQLTPADPHVVDEVVIMLEAEAADELVAAAAALGNLGARAADHRGKLLLILEGALVNCDYSMAEHLIAAFVKLSPAPADEIAHFFEERDVELKAAAMEVLKEMQAPHSGAAAI
jgi:hypothetical protein